MECRPVDGRPSMLAASGDRQTGLEHQTARPRRRFRLAALAISTWPSVGTTRPGFAARSSRDPFTASCSPAQGDQLPRSPSRVRGAARSRLHGHALHRRLIGRGVGAESPLIDRAPGVAGWPSGRRRRSPASRMRRGSASSRERTLPRSPVTRRGHEDVGLAAPRPDEEAEATSGRSPEHVLGPGSIRGRHLSRRCRTRRASRRYAAISTVLAKWSGVLAVATAGVDGSRRIVLDQLHDPVEQHAQPGGGVDVHLRPAARRRRRPARDSSRCTSTPKPPAHHVLLALRSAPASTRTSIYPVCCGRC